MTEQQTHAYFVQTFDGWQGPFFSRPERIIDCDITLQAELTKHKKEKIAERILTALNAEGATLADADKLCDSVTITELRNG